jgi:hypothetical protein
MQACNSFFSFMHLCNQTYPKKPPTQFTQVAFARRRS